MQGHETKLFALRKQLNKRIYEVTNHVNFNLLLVAFYNFIGSVIESVHTVSFFLLGKNAYYVFES